MPVTTINRSGGETTIMGNKLNHMELEELYEIISQCHDQLVYPQFFYRCRINRNKKMVLKPSTDYSRTMNNRHFHVREYDGPNGIEVTVVIGAGTIIIDYGNNSHGYNNIVYYSRKESARLLKQINDIMTVDNHRYKGE